MRLRHLSVFSLFVLAACDQAPVDPDELDAAVDPDAPGFDQITGEPDEGEYLEAEYDLSWDDPTYRPDFDRNHPDNMLLADLSVGTYTATDIAEWIYKGQSGGDRLGITVASGDFLSNGRDDFFMGSQFASGTGGGDGAGYMDKAKLNDAGAFSRRVDSAKGKWFGPSGERAGQYVASGGDHNNDGFEDLAMGATNHTHTPDSWKTNAGAVYLVNGFTNGSNTLPATSITIQGDKAFDLLGAGVSFLPDRNSDSNDELLIGATGGDSNGSASGTIYLVNGPITANADIPDIADATIGGENAGDGAGARMESAGDINGDGVGDIIIGVRNEDTRGTNAGAVYIITNTTYPSDLGSSDTIIRGNAAGAAAGNYVTGIGDINGDGIDDVAVGSLGHNNNGLAAVVYGSSSGIASDTLGNAADIKIFGQQSGDQFGATVFAGDWDGDGDVDLGASANRQTSSDRGAVYLFIDPATGSDFAYNADIKISGDGSGDYFGSWVAVAENTDFFGHSKLLIGASSRGSDDKGAVYVIEYDAP